MLCGRCLKIYTTFHLPFKLNKVVVKEVTMETTLTSYMHINPIEDLKVNIRSQENKQEHGHKIT